MEILESSNGNYRGPRSGLALGRITRVDSVKRFCEVKTFFGEPGLNDLYIEQCQWLAMDGNPEGDEFTAIPRRGSIGLVLFIDSMPFIFGYFRPQTREFGAANDGTQTYLNEGDKVISTVGGNVVAIKANGVIEIRSKQSLKTIYYPKEGLLANLCEAYELNCDGGYTKWKIQDPNLNTTLHKQEFRKDLARTCCVMEETGYVDATTVKKVTIGPMLPGVEDIVLPVFTYTHDVTGKILCDVGLAGTGLNIELTPTGSATIKNLFGSANLSEMGDWTFKTPLVEVGWTATGDMNFKGPVGSASIDKTGNITLKNAIASITTKSTGDFEVKNATATMKASATGDVEASNKSKCALTMKAAGEVKLTGPVGKLKIAANGKIGLGGPAAELLDLVDQFLDALINQTQLVMTGSGPSGPLNPPAMTKLVAIKTKLGTIKGSI